jgi:DNA-binding NarL/FixJ family response regulator
MAAVNESRDDKPAGGEWFSSDETLRVVVVDDDALFRRAVRALLETDRFLTVVGEAADGEAAVKLATELAPDVILMDLDMPGMDGLEAIARLARRTPSPPVIVLTGSNDPRAVERALQAGAARYIQKSHIADICGLVVAVGRGEAGGA